MDKVKLPRELAEAIDTISRMQNWKHQIMGCMYDTQRTLSREMGIVYSYFRQSEETGLEILSSLVNGYEVEQTPGEKVRDYFDKQYSKLGNFSQDNSAYAIRNTLDLLGIEIEGVNA